MTHLPPRHHYRVYKSAQLQQPLTPRCVRCCFWLGNLRRIVLRKSVQLFNHLKRICLPRHRVQEVPDNDNLYLCVSVPVNPCESVFDPPRSADPFRSSSQSAPWRLCVRVKGNLWKITKRLHRMRANYAIQLGSSQKSVRKKT